MTSHFKIALAGNPNCGKTALFNALTKSRQRVGNWPGVTVERKEGHFHFEQQQVTVVDLPGCYSLNACDCDDEARDKQIACQFLAENHIDVIVNVIDASNLERNLYLTTQLLEMGLPVVIALNMMDLLEVSGLNINIELLSKTLGCDIVPIVAKKAKGLKTLQRTIIANATQTHLKQSLRLPYPEAITAALDQLSPHIVDTNINARWLALRLLENETIPGNCSNEATNEEILSLRQRLQQALHEDIDTLIAATRYEYSHNLVAQVINRVKTKSHSLTDRIDKVVLNRVLGIPVFLLVMYLMFVFAINVGGAFQDFFDISSTAIFVNGLAQLLTALHFPNWLIAILANGIGKGINTTITFIPVIGGMFLFLSFLEDSGYMARAAFVMDRFMRALGLPGRSFVPMIVGFGCNVPAVMGARTLENRRDRILTVMMMPFMSCGARLAIFAVFAAAFFKTGGQDVIFLLYLSGIVVAILTGLILRKTLLPGKSAPLVMELPNYHRPHWPSIFKTTWHRLKTFLRRAGRVIVPVCILIGTLNAINIHGGLNQQDASTDSVLSKVGQVVTPVFYPMGVKQDNWPATVGLATGVLAKEVVIGTLNTLYSQEAHLTLVGEQQNVWQSLKAAALSVPQNLAAVPQAFSNPFVATEPPHDVNHAVMGVMAAHFGGKIAAFAYLLFVLLYFPCISTLAVMKREVNNRWAWFSMLWSAGIAYGLSVISYQSLTFTSHPWFSGLWIAGILFVLAVVIAVMKHYARIEMRNAHTPSSSLTEVRL